VEDKKKFDENYWSNRYQSNNTGWDIGYPSTPFIEYFNQIKNTSLKILIPGCGNGYEAEYLHNKGFKNLYVIDIAEEPLSSLKQRVPSIPIQNLIKSDFFDHLGEYDIILEQTFFCALSPSLRKKYVHHTHSLLKDNGTLVGLLFEGEIEQNQPPFKATRDEYLNLFSGYFNVKTLDSCYNSIPPREGKELFINLRKKCLKE